MPCRARKIAKTQHHTLRKEVDRNAILVNKSKWKGHERKMSSEEIEGEERA